MTIDMFLTTDRSNQERQLREYKEDCKNTNCAAMQRTIFDILRMVNRPNIKKTKEDSLVHNVVNNLAHLSGPSFGPFIVLGERELQKNKEYFKDVNDILFSN